MLKNPLVWVLIVVLGLGVAGYMLSSGALNPDTKLYVAIEGEGKIAVIDTAKNKVLRNIDLSKDHDGGKLAYAPHNVQVAPDGKSVWVTANAGSHMEHSSIVPVAHAHGEAGSGPDEVIVINTKNDRIESRIQIGMGVHLAHVVLTPDSKTAYVTAQKEGVVYKINAESYAIEKKITAPPGSEPHGLRISTDGQSAYIAMLAGKSLGILDLSRAELAQVPLSGQAVQAGVTPDGKYAFASIYDKKTLAVYDIATKKVREIKLPESSKGPIQMYPTPDSQFVYIADQGFYFEQPEGTMVYKIDLKEGKVTAEIKAGRAPHGVVVSKDGKFVYITNLVDGSVSVIDTAQDKEVGTILVGKEPNGVSAWSKTQGGTL